MNISMVQMDLSKVQNWRFWTHASMPSWSPNPVFRAKDLVPLEMILFGNGLNLFHCLNKHIYCPKYCIFGPSVSEKYHVAAQEGSSMFIRAIEVLFQSR